MDFDARTTYIHTPLQDASSQIRLLSLLPGEGDEIHCTIAAYDVASAPAYSAISYTWGSRENPQTIWIDSKPLKVTQNCHYALWQARLHFPHWQTLLGWSENFVWIDSICIQQTDLSEKAKQVAMMGDIYKDSALVLGCVGAHDDTSRLLMEALVPLYNLIIGLSCADYASCLRNLSRAALFDLNLWVKKFSMRPYWSRLWILQELYGGMFSRNWILCGDSMLMYHYLDTVTTAFRDFYEDSRPLAADSHWQAYDHLRSNRLWMVTRVISCVIMDDVFEMLPNFECEDPRDKIYGTLGKLRHCVSLDLDDVDVDLVPDYALSAWEVALRMMGLFTKPRSIRSLLLCLKISIEDVGAAARDRGSYLYGSVDRKQKQMIELWAVGSYRARLDAHGRLTINTVSCEVADRVSDGLIVDVSRDSHTNSALPDVHACAQQSIPRNTGSANGAVISVHCEIRSGDLLLEPKDFPRYMVVVRPASSGSDVIGYATWLNKTAEELALVDAHYKASRRARQKHVWMDKLEAMLMVLDRQRSVDLTTLKGPHPVIPVFGVHITDNTFIDQFEGLGRRNVAPVRRTPPTITRDQGVVVSNAPKVKTSPGSSDVDDSHADHSYLARISSEPYNPSGKATR